MRPRPYLCLFVPILSRPMCASRLFCPLLWPLPKKAKCPLASPSPQHMVPLQLRSTTRYSGSRKDLPRPPPLLGRPFVLTFRP